MEFSKLTKWIGLSGLVVALTGCPGGDDTSDTTINTTTPMTTTNGTTTDASGEGSSTAVAESTGGESSGEASTGEPACDPPCEAGQQCVMGECFGGGDTSTGDPPPTNSDYGPCPMCPAGETPVQIMGIEGCFCSPGCDGAMSACPAPNEGTATGACVLGQDPMMPTQCALVCDPTMMDMCPTGATCQDTGMMGVGLCTHPAPA